MRYVRTGTLGDPERPQESRVVNKCWKKPLLFQIYLLSYLILLLRKSINFSGGVDVLSKFWHSNWALWLDVASRVTVQCDQIGQFIGLWASFWSLWQQLICPNLPHFKAIIVKLSKSILFSEIIFGQFLLTIGDFFLVTLCDTLKPLRPLYIVLCAKNCLWHLL